MEVPSIGTVVIVGIGLVMVILILLVFILDLEGAIFKSIDRKKAERAKNIAADAEVVPAPVSPADPMIESGIPAEVVAAIAAAVAAMDGGKYTLRSLTRKKDGRGPWNVAATVSYTQPF